MACLRDCACRGRPLPRVTAVTVATSAWTEGSDARFQHGEVRNTDFRNEWDRHYVMAVRHAAQRTYERAAWRPPHEVYLVLAQELEARGITPEPDAVFDGARLISQGRRPRVLSDS